MLKKIRITTWLPGIALYIILMTAFFALPGCGDGGGEDSDNSAEIVCLGDSLTAGMSATTVYADDKSKSYPAFLQNKVTVTVANAGVSGDTTTDALARLQNDVISKNPDIVVICLGANDVFNSSTDNLTDGTTVSTIGSNLQDILNALDTEGRIIFIAKFYSSANADTMLTELGVTDSGQRTALVSSCNNMFNNLATVNADLVLIEDIWNGVWGINMSSDGIHPTAAGYETMADNYFNEMENDLSDLGWIK